MTVCLVTVVVIVVVLVPLSSTSVVVSVVVVVETGSWMNGRGGNSRFSSLKLEV